MPVTVIPNRRLIVGGSAQITPAKCNRRLKQTFDKRGIVKETVKKNLHDSPEIGSLFPESFAAMVANDGFGASEISLVLQQVDDV